MNPNKILLSFIGTNDSGKVAGKSEGAIFNTVKILKFDEVRLLWTENNRPNDEKNKYLHIGNDLKKKLIAQNKCKNIFLDFVDLNNPVDHNEIYPKLLEYCNNLDTSKHNIFTAAISSGTPAMQVCWILMAESGDFKLNLIRTNEPSFGGDIITSVKLGTGLPRILAMGKYIKTLETLLPELKIYVNKHKILIGNIEIKLSQMELSYYRYFVEKAYRSEDAESIPGNFLPLYMGRKILKYHKDSFPNSDTREDLENAVRNNSEIPKARLSENMTNIQKKIFESLNNDNIAIKYVIQNTGKRKHGKYEITLDKKKITII